MDLFEDKREGSVNGIMTIKKKIGQKPLDAGIRVLESDLTDNTLDSCVTDQGGNEVEFSFSVCSGICDGGKTWAKKMTPLRSVNFSRLAALYESLVPGRGLEPPRP